jgi:hypothetical protein
MCNLLFFVYTQDTYKSKTMASKQKPPPMWERLVEFGERDGSGVVNVAAAIEEFWANGGDQEFRDRRALAARVYETLGSQRVKPLFKKVEKGLYKILCSKEDYLGGSPYGSLGGSSSTIVRVRLQNVVVVAIAKVPRQSEWLRDVIIAAAVRDGYLEKKGDR